MITLQISKRKIGPSYPVFIIAEAGVNYNNNLSTALKMVDVAKASGADAIKFQTFIADEIQLLNSKKPEYQNKIKKNYYDIIKELEPNFEDQKTILNYCKQKNILFLSTPYDKKSVDFLFNIGIKAFKISSSDFTNHLLLEYIAKKKKPMLLSTGMSTMKNIVSTINFLKNFKMEKKIALLQTTSNYPVPSDELNINVISELKNKFKFPIGFSDHSPDYVASLGAVALGAKIVEKHFTLNRKFKGPDQSSSLEPKELQKWISNIRILEKSLGSSKKVITKSERKNLSMKKIIVIKPAQTGKIITKDLLETKRGNLNGILPTTENLNKIIGHELKKEIKKPTQLSWKFIE